MDFGNAESELNGKNTFIYIATMVIGPEYYLYLENILSSF